MAIRIRTQEELASIQILSPETGALAYSKLRSQVRNAGLLDRNYGYYALLTSLVFAAFFLSFVGVYFAHNLVLVLVFTLCFGFASAQIGGLIHDSAHRTVFKSELANDIFGHLCTVFFSGSYGNWRLNHNRHHACPNRAVKDPDIEIPFGFSSEHFEKLSGFMGSIKRFQKWTYYPIGLIASLTMRFKRYDYFKENFGPPIYWEIGLFALSVFIRFLLPLWLLGFEKGIIFLVISTAVEGFLLFHVFAPNHKGMLEFSMDVAGMSFLEQQIVTSRNIIGHPVTDTVFMGLNYQIEHHLFPNAPRNNLKKIRPYVRAVCEEYGLPYSNVGVIESNRQILADLDRISAAA